MEAEIFKRVIELRKMGVTTSGMPDAWRREIARAVTDGMSIKRVSDATKINMTTIESWVKKFADAELGRTGFKEVEVVEKGEVESSDFRIKVEVIKSGCSTKFESSNKEELIRLLKKVL